MQLSSRGIIDHAKAVALEERTLHVARVENPPTSAVRQHDGSPSSLQDLKPNSEADASEDRTLQVARVENPQRPPYASTMAAHHPYRPLSPTQKPSPWKTAPYELLASKRPPYANTMAADHRYRTLNPTQSNHPYRTLNPTQKPSPWKTAPYELLAWKTLQRPPYSTMASNHPYRTTDSEADASEDRTLRVARVENPPTSAVRQHDGIQSSAQDIKPKSEAIASADRTGNRSVENPPTLSRKTTKPRSPVTPKARIAKAPADQDLPWRVASAPQRRGVGLFIFAPPGF